MAYVLKIKARYKCDATGKELLLPAIVTENGILVSHLRYLAAKSQRSQSWRERSIFALILLIKYININQGYFTKTTDLLRSFTETLTEGSINPATLEDPSGLFWSPRKLLDANSLLSHITYYTDYLAQQDGYERSRINPFRKANSVEQRLNWCAYYHKQANVFLSHLSDNSELRKHLAYIRKIRSPDAPVVSIEPAVRFPEDEIQNLLERGFVRPRISIKMSRHDQYDYKNQAITILMHYGGIRISEIFHIYIFDIIIDKKRLEAVVRVYHPSNGQSPDTTYRTRKEFLARRYNLIPRTDYPVSKRQHCGWKSPLLNDRRGFYQVFFCPPERATDFLFAWENYLKFQRVNPPDTFEHPYAFTNLKGYPETIKNFQRLHKDAVQRIGLKQEKYIGTTPHGHRHSYGYRLREHGLDQYEIQKAMHHKALNSCLVYIQPSCEDIRSKLRGTEE